MSKLPPALAARLAKRGLLQSTANAPPTTTNVPNRFEEEEEVIAEDYDDLDKSSSTFDPIITATSFSKIDRKVYPTVAGCPNKYNVYHNCSAYCVKRYRDLEDQQQPPKVVKKKFRRLLQKFPLKQEQTEIWEQVYDPGLKTFYFWNTETDQVSWLPPSHPDCKPSIPAEKLRKLLREDDDEDDDEEDNDDFDNNRRNRGSEDSGNSDESGSDDDEDDDLDNDSDLEGSMNSDASDSVNSEEEDNPTRPCSKFPIRKSQVAPPMALSKTTSNKIESNNQSRKQIPQTKRNDLDPMDPASYSDIPRGKWSDGLKESREKGD